MDSFVSMGRWSCGHGVKCVGMTRVCGVSDGSCAEIHARGMYCGDFGSSVCDGYVMLDVNGYGLLKGDMRFIREEWWLMYMYGCCSNTERQFAKMCTRGAHYGDTISIGGLIHIDCLLDDMLDRRKVRPMIGMASKAVMLDMYIVDKMRKRVVHCNGSSFKPDGSSADVIHLDEGSLEGSESHLRSARTPANFLEMSAGDVTTDARTGILTDRNILSAVLSLSADVIHLDEDSLEGSES